MKMNNKFNIEQISTDQFVLRRQNVSKSEYITNTLDVIVLDSIGSHNEVVFTLNQAASILNNYNIQEAFNENIDRYRVPGKSGDYIIDNNIKNLSIKSVKFKSVLHKNGLEEVIGVDKDE